MIHANPPTFDAGSAETRLSAEPGQTTAGSPAFPPLRAYSRPAAGCSVTPHPAAALELREEDRDYVPDIPSGRQASADPALRRAAAADTVATREAMTLIDEATNLVSVLIAAIEDEADARASQAETVLRIVRKKLDKAHRRVDRQESRHRNLFLAYGELKERSERDEE